MIRYLNGFDFSGTAAILNSNTYVYDFNFSGAFPQGRYIAGRYGGTAINPYNSTFTNSIWAKVFESRSTWTVGFDFKITDSIVDSGYFFAFYDQSTDGANCQIGLQFTSGGFIQVCRGNPASATILATGTTAIPLDTWKYIELQVTFHNTTGSYELRIEDQIELIASGVNTRNTSNSSANIAALRWLNVSTNGVAFDNYYIADTQGTINNTFLGPIRIDTYIPASDDSVQFTPSTGANWSCVDDNSPTTFGSDTDSNVPTALNQKDTFNVTSVGSYGQILGIQHNVYANRNTGFSYNIKSLVKVSGTDYESTDTLNLLPKTEAGYPVAINNLQSLSDIRELNPSNSASWTPSEVNSVKYGYKAV